MKMGNGRQNRTLGNGGVVMVLNPNGQSNGREESPLQAISLIWTSEKEREMGGGG